jgi:histone acetyltransferase 1
VASYHRCVQRLATWFIETADDVNVANDRDGRWKILYLFRRHEPVQFSLAGYITLYHFRSPFRKPRPGTVVRICQALILPPYQRMGHGHRMLNCVYDVAHGVCRFDAPPSPPRGSRSPQRAPPTEPIVEVNVEDPAPAFAALRNRVDMDRFGNLPRFAALCPVTDASFFSGLDDAEASEASEQLKITPAQVHVVHELVKLRSLNTYRDKAALDDGGGGDGGAVPVGELSKRYRLMVKKRLNKLYRENLGGRTKPEAQRVLGELFDECHDQYQRLLRRTHA